MDAYDCETCGLRWAPADRHPPCLKLSPEERRLLGATAATAPPVNETKHSDA